MKHRIYLVSKNMKASVQKFSKVFVATQMIIAVSTGAQSFNFESVPAGYYSSPLTLTSGGLALTITTEGTPNGYLIVDDPSVTLLGTRAVVGNRIQPTTSGEFIPLRFSFSLPVINIAFAFGDNGGDDDSPVIISAFNSNGSLLGTLSETYPLGFNSGKTISGVFESANYIIVSSGIAFSGNENSLFWEIPSVTYVPEPSATALGALALVAILRRKSQNKKRFAK